MRGCAFGLGQYADRAEIEPVNIAGNQIIAIDLIGP